ncbi:MAG: hypothetical protein CVV64_19485 [Candidatus Wallbacteria bacterium HGW-Wallbacteria-1]|jgi:2-polyprenyl-3-methyl-5-hydroxy-6-metoxy-1,4-benzoquinol methylase|uniref:Class I SAM-dependent methyltransferase n=1 Tax=Candidatus Wallbacteria bacterium HGW-Wallbacteria-1 TaxID=2013854 RepID=A0A2N1PIW4_9BACT|nr:MAG: hypothetical protein CVV64_19485 [Candidatus Wallbacteria bacterium HGW-Wallbacteria-1]
MQINGAAFHSSLHLDEKDLLPESSLCPICGAEICPDQIQGKSFSLQDDPRVLLRKCGSCHAASASRMPTQEALNRYYCSYYESALSSSAGNVTFEDSRRFARHLTNTILRFSPVGHISILDFGGGDGSLSCAMALELVEHGVDSVKVTVVDYGTELIASPDSRIVLRSLSSLDGSTGDEPNGDSHGEFNGEFNIIIASAVLEHIPDAGKTLHRLLDLLSPGGFFYARTPVVLPLMKLCALMGIKWDFTFPAHLHDLGQNFWESVFTGDNKKGRFRVIKSKPSIVETTFRGHFLRTLAACVLKTPWYLLGSRYQLVGGWEILVRKNGSAPS